MDLITTSQLAAPDAAYNMIVDAHRGLDEKDSAVLNARLVFLLANHIGELSVLEQAIALAKEEL
ncbi:DUF2783 domain-containing protein [Breoghania sp.]|uniref:DUF2783 domain-containing protein n=1 Tax=Breoghania sp. TaxID=2065378 RepID=UPI0026018E22|nr:DUF2783 domain-containing protein [Breoghania sp.]MDJ0932136.1 DUF2783 domain-containing protein [Breoghania sp.]